LSKYLACPCPLIGRQDAFSGQLKSTVFILAHRPSWGPKSIKW